MPIRGIRSCGIETLSHLAPHLEQLQRLALWGRLWGRLGSRLWNGFFFLDNHTKIKSSGVQYQADCCLSRRTHHKHDNHALPSS